MSTEKKNPFNITQYKKNLKKEVAAAPTKTNQKSAPNNIKKLLDKYDEISPEHWPHIKQAGAKPYIIFFKKKESDPEFSIEEYADTYRRGFVQFVKPQLYEDGTSRMVFGVSWEYSYDPKKIFVIPLDEIKKLWRKKPTEKYSYNSIELSLNNIVNEITKIRVETSEKIEYLESKIVEMRGNLENLVDVIVKMRQK